MSDEALDPALQAQDTTDGFDKLLWSNTACARRWSWQKGRLGWSWTCAGDGRLRSVGLLWNKHKKPPPMGAWTWGWFGSIVMLQQSGLS